MQKIEMWAGALPIGRVIEWLVVVATCAVVLTVTGCGSIKEAVHGSSAPVQAAVSTPVAPAAPAEPLNAFDATAARAQALQAIGVSATDAETKRLAIFALVTMGQGGQPAQPVVVQGPRTIGDAIFGFLDRTFERGFAVAPAILAYKGQMRQAQTTEIVAGINRDVSISQGNNFLALGVAGIGGTQNVGIAGVNALANVASRPVVPGTVVTGNTGPVNVGGTQTYAPITSSYNPTNPTRVCTIGTAGVTSCSGP